LGESLRSAANQEHVGEKSMETPLEQKPPDRPAAENTSRELIRLIHKLRWVGMEEEAERLLKKLKREHSAAADSTLVAPSETD
jgi:hypothetical protein